MDRFNDIWKNRFNAEEVPVDDWSSPGDAVWSSIAKELPTHKKKRPFWLFWASGSLLIAILFSTVIYCNQDSFETRTSLQNLKETSILVNETIQSPELLNVSPTKKEIITNIEKDIDSINEPIKNSFASDGSNHVSKKVIAPKSHDNLVEITQPIINNNITNVKEEKAITSVVNNSTVEDINTADFADSKREFVDINQLENIKLSILNLEQSVISIPQQVKVINKRLVINLKAGLMIWNHQLSDNFQSALSPFDFNYEENGIGWTTGLEIDAELNDYLHLSTGINYDQVNTQSGHNSAIDYNLSAETENNNEYSQALATPYGFMDSEFQLRRTTDLSDEQVNLLVDFDSEHLIQNVSVPVGLKVYPLKYQNRLMPFISAGFGVNYLTNISNNLDNIDTHHSAIHYESNSANLQTQAINNWHFDARIGAGLNYTFRKNIQFNIQYNYTKGLNPIFELDEFTTKINRHYFTIALTKPIK